ncbi:MAG: hypothetical protein HXX11_22515 [Desulfuromonadales bacterium]|nr:hypothetical protein [Desulfuromonadales bacterium]
MKVKRALVWFVFLTSILSSTAYAQQSGKGTTAVPGKFDSYVFSLSWQPAFCETKPDKKECISQTADRYDANNLVLHGLWPNKKGDTRHVYGFCNVKNSIRKLDNASTWCKMPAPGLTDDTKNNLSTVMPGYASCLERHEWYKHGTCSNLEANEYFSTASSLVAKVAETNFGKYISANVGNTVNSDDLISAFEKDFGPGSRDYVNLYCQDKQGASMLLEVRMYLTKSLPSEGELKSLLVRPDSSEQGTCPQKILIDPVHNATGLKNTSTTDTSSSKPNSAQISLPAPLLEKGHPVDWWFVFKFNAATSPGCGGTAQRNCLFGGAVQDYKGQYSQQFVYASSENPALQQGTGCVGDTLKDPVGATFDEIYNGSFNYVIWNDQFYGDPAIQGCGDSCGSPWGHSKGLVAWNDTGEGYVMQVSTPSWPASGSASTPRADGNTLGCIHDNDVKVSQHFFALKLSKDDIKKVIQALQNASVVTDPTNKQIVHNGGPSDVQELVKQLGIKSSVATQMVTTLSSGVKLISKPSELHVPPWQMVSATLDGTPLRAATWWANPKIETTSTTTKIDCWSNSLGAPGPVQIATSGQWNGKVFSLKGGPQLDSNHAKIGVSTNTSQPYAIFGDLNQQGALSGNCASSQNGRGGLFYVLNNKPLFDGLTNLIKGETATATP